MLSTTPRGRSTERKLSDGDRLAALELAIGKHLASFKGLGELDKRYSALVRAGKMEESRSIAKGLGEMYDEWLKQAKLILKDLKGMEAAGQKVAGGHEFRDAVGYCPAGLNADATAASFKRMSRGEGVPLTGTSRNGKVHHRRAS